MNTYVGGLHMGQEEKTLAELLGDMEHYSMVVEDIEEAVKYFSAMGYKFGDIEIRARSPDNNPTMLRGKPITYTLKAAVARNTKPALELQEVVEGEPTQKELLDTKGPCVHHLGHLVTDMEVVIARFKELGIDAIQQPMERHRWAMMDTVDMCGTYIEIHE